MRYTPIVRDSGAFQRPVTPEQVEMVIVRAFGPAARPSEAVELGGGLWNTTLRVDGGGFPGPVIVRFAPEGRVQTRTERDLMRTEHAVAPFLAPIACLVPQILFADFTRQLVPRDVLVQSFLPGVPAAEVLPTWAPGQAEAFYRRLGELTREVHAVRGTTGFGRVGGDRFTCWSGQVNAELTDLVADLEAAGLDASDLRRVIAVCQARPEALDQITLPQLTLGDLWVPNVMVDPATASPTICGVFDTDRAVWGDPLADWTIFQATQKPGTEVEAFWDGYGRPVLDADGVWRSHVYAARHWGAIRLERHRLGRTKRIPATYTELGKVLAVLGG
ncbi:phosphotransferase family protein [Actinomadura viridis]|uniref:phosphotransferase family protein n=1 Tax=Actinomadura viridis TaxID=58110 RepID=UPI0036A46BC0